MRAWRTFFCTVLTCLMLTEGALAAPILMLSRVGEIGVTSKVRVSPDLTEEEAAERLYYLGLLSGVGIREGKIDFALSRNLTRLESLVLTARLLGVESELLEMPLTHPFTDVPVWGAPYVAYFYEYGLIDAEDSPDGIFSPEDPVSSTEFLTLMFYCLGYKTDGTDYSLPLTDWYGEQSGICPTHVETVTRGVAAQMILRTLNTEYMGEEMLLSERFVTEREMGYQDALFLLWCEDKATTAQYVKSRGYTTEKILADGKYTIVLDGTTRCLNVLVDGGNNDYEGVGVSIWRRTGDVSQQFRVVRTEAGTYHLYSCASSGGYNRVLGIGKYGTGGLYTASSRYAGEYYIRYSDAADGSWEIIPVSDTTKRLACAGDRGGLPVKLLERTDETALGKWTFEFNGIVNEDGNELALFPSDTLCVTQGPYDTYSHQKQNALDITTSNRKVFAPFTGEIVRIDRGYSRYNTVWLQSTNKVVYADGTVDYMTVVFMHDDNVADLSVGQILAQGEYFYDMGVAGGATGAHVHIACIQGKYKSTMGLTGSGDVYAEDALFVTSDTTVLVPYGINWIYTD